jgi:hypothetical protein
MPTYKAGARLRSAVCTTEIMVVAAPSGEIELSCGGTPMLAASEKPPASPQPAGTAPGSLLGKRYVNDGGDLEVLCTKSGAGTLAANGVLLKQKEAKKLPSSD